MLGHLCDICDRSFRKKGALTMHRRTHFKGGVHCNSLAVIFTAAGMPLNYCKVYRIANYCCILYTVYHCKNDCATVITLQLFTAKINVLLYALYTSCRILFHFISSLKMSKLCHLL